ncbi:hypothetical protein F4825DRAFT_475521 [Nemania diffusa]|nr:hypothetical protein F4825DRAFT_475521 [Nemania diffusa]
MSASWFHYVIICVLALVVYLACVNNTEANSQDYIPENPFYDWKRGWNAGSYYGLDNVIQIQGEKRRMAYYWGKLCSTLPKPDVLDFLLCCVHAAVEVDEFDPKFVKWHVLPTDFPLDPSTVHEVTDSFPAFHHCTTISDLIGTENLRAERCILLMWLATTFQCQIFAAQGDLYVPGIPSLMQFIQLSSETWRHHDFENLVAAKCGKGGRAAFHGTAAINLLNILCRGLKARNKLVYYAADPELSLNYIYFRSQLYNKKSMGIMKGWENSAFQNVAVLLGVEVATTKVDWSLLNGYCMGKCSTDEVAVRHLFLIPEDDFKASTKRENTTPKRVSVYQGSDAREAMENIYPHIHEELYTVAY